MATAEVAFQTAVTEALSSGDPRKSLQPALFALERGSPPDLVITCSIECADKLFQKALYAEAAEFGYCPVLRSVDRMVEVTTDWFTYKVLNVINGGRHARMV